MPRDTRPLAPDTLAQLPEAEFITHWCNIIGEPPALMLGSRSEMIRLLIESAPDDLSRLGEQAPDRPQDHPSEG